MLEFSDELNQACKYCATFARAKTTEWWKLGFAPSPTNPTGTITFVEFDNRTFAMTAWHVIEEFQKAAIREGVYPESYFLPSAPGVSIGPPFLRPPAEFGGHQPDVGLRPIHPSLPGHIGKKAFVLDGTPAPDNVPYAMAVGFPTNEKTAHTNPLGDQLAMRCVQAIADGVGSNPESDQAQFRSELEGKLPTGSLSGMSGGPVFWSVGTAFGLFGIVKETMEASKPGLANGAVVHFMCQRVSYQDFASWVAFLDKNYQNQRDSLLTPPNGSTPPPTG